MVVLKEFYDAIDALYQEIDAIPEKTSHKLGELFSLLRRETGEREEAVLESYELQTTPGIIEGSYCIVHDDPDKKGPLQQYRVVRMHYGDGFKEHPQNSTDLGISALCGTRSCQNMTHILIESKETIDDRSRCIGFMRELWLGASTRKAVRLLSKGCFHDPKCGQRKDNQTKKPDVEETSAERDVATEESTPRPMKKRKKSVANN